MSGSRILQRIGNGTLYAVRTFREQRLPRLQFIDGDEVPGTGEVLQKVREGVHPVSVENWFTFQTPTCTSTWTRPSRSRGGIGCALVALPRPQFLRRKSCREVRRRSSRTPGEGLARLRPETVVLPVVTLLSKIHFCSSAHPVHRSACHLRAPRVRPPSRTRSSAQRLRDTLRSDTHKDLRCLGLPEKAKRRHAGEGALARKVLARATFGAARPDGLLAHARLGLHERQPRPSTEVQAMVPRRP